MAFGHSRGTMVVCLTVSVSFTESIIFILVKFLMMTLILDSVTVQISMTNSNSYLKIARKSFKPLTTSRLRGR